MLTNIRMKNFLHKIKTHQYDLIFLMSLIYISDDTFLFGTSDIAGIEMVKYIYIIIIAFILLLKFRLNKSQKSLVIVSIALILISALMSFSLFSGGLLILICTIIIAVCTTNKFNIFEFGTLFSTLIYIINIYSLCIWLIVSLHFAEAHPISNKIGALMQTYCGCMFFSGSIPGFYRNSSIFREPGMYMIFICIAYIFDTFTLSKRIGLFKLIIYVLSLLSTFSTAGFIIFGLLFSVNLLQKSIKFFLTRSIIPIVLITAVIVFVNSNGIGAYIFGKFDKGEQSASYLGRESSITIPLHIIACSPIYGCGIKDFKSEYIDIGQKLYHTDINPDGLSTNTILNIGAIFGLPLCAIMVFGIYKFSQISTYRKITKLIIFIAILMMFSNESAMYSLPFYWLVFYGYKGLKTKDLNNYHLIN